MENQEVEISWLKLKDGVHKTYEATSTSQFDNFYYDENKNRRCLRRYEENLQMSKHNLCKYWFPERESGVKKYLKVTKFYTKKKSEANYINNIKFNWLLKRKHSHKKF